MGRLDYLMDEKWNLVEGILLRGVEKLEWREDGAREGGCRKWILDIVVNTRE